MKLLMKALERRIIVSSPIKDWFESEWFHITSSWWIFCISHWDQKVKLTKLTKPSEEDYAKFSTLLKSFLVITFPA